MHVNVLLDSALGAGYPSGGAGEYRYDCPLCRLGGRTLCVNYVRKRFICFHGRCQAAGSLAYLCSRIGIDYEEQPLLSSIDQLRHRLWGLEDGTSEAAPKIADDVHVPELRQIREGHPAWAYLRSVRNLTPHDIYYNQLSVSPEDRERYIYFPHHDENGRVVYWVKRKYLPGTKGPKYRNPGASIKSKLLYRENLVDFAHPVIVVEGPLSAIAAGNAVATLGVKFSEEQVRLAASWGVPLYAAMDGEEFSRSVKFAEAVQKYGACCAVVPMPQGEDPNSLGWAAFYECLCNSFVIEAGATTVERMRLARLW